MPAVHETAYPRLEEAVTPTDLAEVYTPTGKEIALAIDPRLRLDDPRWEFATSVDTAGEFVRSVRSRNSSLLSEPHFAQVPASRPPARIRQQYQCHCWVYPELARSARRTDHRHIEPLADRQVDGRR
jgi:hypothetical protein